jgi:tartrate dehydratase alpha subunit/fumarate hydratase class I-like protein
MTSKNRIAGWAARIAEAQEITHETIAGVEYQRVRYGFDYPDGKTTCRDCGVEHYQFHVAGCCVERCPRCEGQAISCDCPELGESPLQ